jgi:23S rRNA pseudouridine1911/1915/1917 synthase
MPTWTVPEDAGRLRLDVFIVGKSKLARHQVQKLIRAGGVLIDKRPAKSVHEWLVPGTKVTTQKPKAEAERELPEIKVLKKTADYLVIAKPAGIAVHGGPGVHGSTIVDWLLEKYPGVKKVGDDAVRPGIVHRLDKPVSGCMAIALTQKMFEHLKLQFTTRQVRKEYVALVYGIVKNDSGSVTVPIGRSHEGHFAAHTQSREHDRDAVTDWEVQKRFTNATLITLRPATGRTHQLRVHCKFMGHSIVGDAVYTTRKQPYRLPPLDRLFLHAAELEFNDLAGGRVATSCALPAGLADYLAELK